MFKIITGEDFIAESRFDSEKQKWILKNAVRLVLHQQGVAMMPLSPFIKEEAIEIKKEHIIFVAEVEDEIKNGYNEKFGTGIVLANGPTTMKLVGA